MPPLPSTNKLPPTAASRGLIDYLETLQMTGVSDISLIVPDELRQKIQQAQTMNISSAPIEPQTKPQYTQPAHQPLQPNQPPFQPPISHLPEQLTENLMPKPKQSVIQTEQTTAEQTTTATSSHAADSWGIDLASENREETLQLLAKRVCDCKKCHELAATRTQTVFGVGNPRAELVFLGEAPGADEDAQGIPFVGRAGKLLTDMIEKGMRLQRNDVYICNILRCRPPANRNPSPEEAAKCRPFLDATLQVIRPKFICCLGAIAATNLLNSQETIGRLRGKIHNYQGIKVVCTYHPAYLLRTPSAKAAAWDDLQILMREMGLPIPQKKG